MGFTEIFAQYSRLARTVEVTDQDVKNYRDLLNDGGFSHHPRLNKKPVTGYMVSRNSNNGGVNHQFAVSELSPEKLAAHRAEMESHGLTRDPDTYQGGWISNGRVYLDVSHNISDRDEAIRRGKEHDQKAIWHIDKNEEIPTGGTGSS